MATITAEKQALTAYRTVCCLNHEKILHNLKKNFLMRVVGDGVCNVFFVF